MNLANRPPLGLKAPAIVSQKIRRSARGQTCTLRIPGVCTGDPETTVACHVQAPGMGTMGGKASDLHVIYGCAACHAVLDNRARWAEAAVGWDDVLRALIETQSRLIRAGLLQVKG
jgi:hypothetical protein